MFLFMPIVELRRLPPCGRGSRAMGSIVTAVFVEGAPPGAGVR